MSAPDVLKLSVNIIWNPDKLVHRLRTQYTPLDLPRNGAHISLFANRLDVPPAMVSRLCDDLAKLASGHKEFDMGLNTEPEVSGNYISIPVNATRLLGIRERLVKKLDALEIINPPERTHAYEPHVTVFGKGINLPEANPIEANPIETKTRVTGKKHRDLRARAVGLQLVKFLPGEKPHVIKEFRFQKSMRAQERAHVASQSGKESRLQKREIARNLKTDSRIAHCDA